MDTASLDFTKLQLLTISQQRLYLAQDEKWSELQALDTTWDALLQKALKTFGNDLKPIEKQLNQDNEALISLVETSQQKLNSSHHDLAKNLSQVKQYLK